MRAAVSSGFSSGKKCPPFIACPCACGAHCRQIPGAPVLSVESVKRATLGQQKQHWAFDSLAGFLIDAIVFDVDRYFSSTSTDGSTPPNWNPWTQASRGRYVADLIVAVDPAITPPEAGMRGPTVRN
jgi:hypothetical protein